MLTIERPALLYAYEPLTTRLILLHYPRTAPVGWAECDADGWEATGRPQRLRNALHDIAWQAAQRQNYACLGNLFGLVDVATGQPVAHDQVVEYLRVVARAVAYRYHVPAQHVWRIEPQMARYVIDQIEAGAGAPSLAQIAAQS